MQDVDDRMNSATGVAYITTREEAMVYRINMEQPAAELHGLRLPSLVSDSLNWAVPADFLGGRF